ncbi:MAG: hypothetical protein IAX21_00830 [Candidatus Bathyarchaeota archaeon]|nr:hypothetical protein [Candidatus Bathyarchaeum tardum]WGM90485.1 MAG: hypothetical protein NUK63_05010 [Candidatus Bathyarchaeum tardum]WNZ29447.1 MAG: hypothetical protein IAX21_00830 [Candidatus Bathyarchaeota archaeon]
MAKAIPLGSVVYVRYLDHVLFKNVPNPIEEPAERETIGWLTKDEKEIVCIENDRTLDKLPYSSGSGSGLVLLKSCIIEIRLTPIQNVSGWTLIPRNTNFRNAESALQTNKRKIQPK